MRVTGRYSAEGLAAQQKLDSDFATSKAEAMRAGEAEWTRPRLLADPVSPRLGGVGKPPGFTPCILTERPEQDTEVCNSYDCAKQCRGLKGRCVGWTLAWDRVCEECCALDSHSASAEKPRASADVAIQRPGTNFIRG